MSARARTGDTMAALAETRNDAAVSARRSRESFGSAADFDRLALEQYRLAVELADRTSARRLTLNSVFITFNTTFVSAAALLAKEGRLAATTWLLPPLVAVLALCLLWWGLIRSYRMLASAKYAVIDDIETQLPFALFGAEWQRLGARAAGSGFFRMTTLERWLPLVFALLYLGLALMVMRS
jgi:hypothetical protein